jgi:hypothetical protein
MLVCYQRILFGRVLHNSYLSVTDRVDPLEEAISSPLEGGFRPVAIQSRQPSCRFEQFKEWLKSDVCSHSSMTLNTCAHLNTSDSE